MLSMHWTNPFRINGLFRSKFDFIQISKSIFYKQIAQNLIRGRVQRRPIWFGTICRCPINYRLGLNELNNLSSVYVCCRSFTINLLRPELSPYGLL